MLFGFSFIATALAATMYSLHYNESGSQKQAAFLAGFWQLHVILMLSSVPRHLLWVLAFANGK
jgi:hypothetical protein